MGNADGSIVIKTQVDNEKAEKELAKLKSDISKTESEVEEISNKKMPLAKRLEELGIKADEAAKKLEEMKNASTGTYTADQIKMQTETVRSLGAQFDSTQREISSYDKKLKSATEKLHKQQEEAGELVKSLNSANKAAIKMAEAQKKAEENTKRFAMRLKSVVRSALVFTLITKALAEVREWVAGLITTNEDARKSVAQLKGALLTMAQPLVNVVIPAFTKAVNVLTSVVIVLGRLFAAIAGTTYEEAKKSAESLNEEQKAIKGVGDAAKKATGQLAAFDEINKIGDSGKQSEYIAPDFSSLDFSTLPEWLQSLTLELEAKIESIRFKYDNGSILRNSDDWSEVLEKILLVVIGAMFGGLKGAVIALALGVAADIVSVEFADKFENKDTAKSLFDAAIISILGAILGAKFGGLYGAGIGFLCGVIFSLVKAEFEKGNSTWSKDETLIVALSAILGAILGGVFGGIKGAVIGLLLGASISFAAVSFTEGSKYSKSEAIASLRAAIITMLGIVLGAVAVKFTGLSTAGVIGALLGLTIGFASVAFDETMDSSVRERAKEGFMVTLMGLIGAIIGTAFLGPVGTVVGGAIGISVGLFINFVIEGWDFVDKNVPNFKGIGPDYSWMFKSSASVASVPGLANGSVVPPNRKFLAVLGDNKTETEVVSPLSTMKQAVMEAMRESGTGNKQTTIVLTGEMAALARVLRPYIEDEGHRVGVSIVTK